MFLQRFSLLYSSPFNAFSGARNIAVVKSLSHSFCHMPNSNVILQSQRKVYLHLTCTSTTPVIWPPIIRRSPIYDITLWSPPAYLHLSNADLRKNCVRTRIVKKKTKKKNINNRHHKLKFTTGASQKKNNIEMVRIVNQIWLCFDYIISLTNFSDIHSQCSATYKHVCRRFVH